MASSTAHRLPAVEVIDLVSDDSDTDSDEEMMGQDQSQVRAPRQMREAVKRESVHSPERNPGPPVNNFLAEQFDFSPRRMNRAIGGTVFNIDGEEIFIPDEDPEDFEAAAGAENATADFTRDHEVALGLNGEPQPNDETADTAAMHEDADTVRDREIALALDNQEVTADYCLQQVLEIFPDIRHEYVFNLYNDFGREGDYETLPGQARLDNIIEQLVSGSSYPKQEKGKQPLKRKRDSTDDEDDIRKWERHDRINAPNYLKGPMQAMLKAEYPDIPVSFINETLAAQKHLYQAFVALAKAKDDSAASNRTYGRGRPSTKHLANANTIATNSGWPELIEELNAARVRVQDLRNERAAEDAKKLAEKENLQKAIAAGETTECSACFDDLPMNRQIHCDGPVAHFTCFDCAHTYIKSEVGESRCRVNCTAGCGAGFANHQLNLIADRPLLEKLAQLQQEKDIRDAGLDNLEECPFCDYKAILPPIEEDFEFRCANPDCEKVSCRRCKSMSHIPLTCEQHAKDNKINSRHKIEEAMTAALIRSCNKCKKQFIKDYGCNKMTCSSCGNLQCYVCSESLKDYNHFDQRPSGATTGGRSKLCPLYDNVEERHEREVKEAEKAARAEVVNGNPDISVDDLEIKVSDAVKKATSDRIQRAGGAAGVAYPVGNVFGGHHAGPGGPLGDANRHLDRLNELNRMMQEVEAGTAGRNRIPQAGVGGRRYPEPALHPQAQAAGLFGGLGERLQGYIPVFGFNDPAPPQPAPPTAPRPAQRAPAQRPQAAPARLGQPLRLNQGLFDDIFGALPYGGDAAADPDFAAVFNPAPPRAPANRNNNNDNGNNGAGSVVPRYAPMHIQDIPGASPGGPQPELNAFVRGTAQDANPFLQNPQAHMPDHRRERRQNFQELEILRQNHDQQMRRTRDMRRQLNEQQMVLLQQRRNLQRQ